MNRRALSSRLVLWYAVWLGAVFLIAGALVYFGLRQYLERNLTAAQTQRAQRIVALVQRQKTLSEPNLAEEISARFAPEANGRFIRVLRPDRTVLYRSGVPHDGRFDPVEIVPGPTEEGTRKVKVSDGTELVLAQAWAGLPRGDGYWVETGESLAPALTELRRLLALLIGAFVVVAALALGGGYRLVRGALRPVEEITRSAERITSRNLSERLPVPPTQDEFEHLSQALNRMISRLEDAIQYNRRFLADASHELRTPLTVLRGELESIVQERDLAPEWRERLGSSLEEAERLARIVEGLLATARLEAGEGQVQWIPFDLAELATATADQMCLLAEDKQIKVTCDADRGVWVEGDRARLKQVVVNLLDNAIKYTPPGGEVRLTVTAADRKATLEVSDSGIGIPPEALPHLFERFFRVNKARSRDQGGVGLGLAIVKSICAAHDGRVEVTSELGRGSCFRVTLPLAFSVPESNKNSENHECRNE